MPFGDCVGVDAVVAVFAGLGLEKGRGGKVETGKDEWRARTWGWSSMKASRFLGSTVGGRCLRMMGANRAARALFSDGAAS